MRIPHLPLPVDDAAGQGVESSCITVPGTAGAPDVVVAIHRPIAASGPLPCIFHIHGGGYVAGSAAEVAPVLRGLAEDLGCVVTSVDYRLAPETPFPGAIEDCYAALTWVFLRAAELDVDPRRIGVMGESAGGGLAAALALFTRDMGGPRLAFQHLVYPMLDDRTCLLADPHPLAGELVWRPSNNRFGWTALLGQAPGSKGVSQYAAAARAESLAGLPPTYLSTAALDLFLEENLEYARRLTRAGVPVELHVWPGAFHGFDLDPSARVAAAARAAGKAWLRRMLWG